MQLLEYLKSLNDDEAKKFAMNCKTTLGQLKQVAYGNRRASPSLAINLDRETKGLLSFEEIRPDIDWSYVQSKVA